MNQLNKEYFEWVKSKDNFDSVAVTLTAKQRLNGVRLDEYSLQQNFRYFKNILNGKVFGNSYRRFGKELKMLVVVEESINQRLHIHSSIEIPKHIEYVKFDVLIRECWKKTLFGYHQIDIKKPSNKELKEGWTTYILKNRSKKEYSSSIDLFNSSCLYLC